MAETVIMPKLGFDMAEGTLVRWVIQEGEPVAKGNVLAEIETDKATVEVESSFEGILFRHLVNQGDVVPVNTPIAVIGKPGEALEPSAKPSAAPQAAAKTPTAVEEKSQPDIVEQAETVGETGLPGGVRASPLAKRLAVEKGVDLRAVPGSGPMGRIVKKDIETYIQNPPALSGQTQPAEAPAKASQPKEPAGLPLPVVSTEAPSDVIVPMNRLRSAIARRMVEVKGAVPHFYVTHEYNLNALMALRKQVNALVSESERISVNDFIIKAVALALRQFPNLNAALRNEQIVRLGAVNIGVAVAVEGGLLTVVCKNADQKPLRQIAREIRSMAARVREGKVRSDDIEGSTFSISNLGMFDVENFIAIINPPEAAILAVGSAREVPVVENGELKIGWRMKATISVDHRISDGAEAAQFLQVLAQYLEQPLNLLL
jgi:pyruvate dehydrogenase E2 component (dihydrolipoamide acetyltransferase)